MAKKKQFVTAAAAFAVAASAVAPAITADAATKTVRLKSDFVRLGNLDATLDKTYNGGEIHWYKSSVDLNKLGVYQTAKGFVKGQGIRVEKRVRVLNFAKEVKPAKEIVLEQGVPASGLRIQPVLFADGNLYDKPVSVQGFNTDKVGEFEGSFTYANKAFGSVTTKVKYKVVASKVAFSEVKHEVKDDTLSVSADVKNLKEGEKVELVIFPGKDESKPLAPITAEVKDGKVSVSAKDVPAGTHSFVLQSGDVKTAAVEFKVEEQAPKVEKVSAINAQQLKLEFNKAVDKTIARVSTNYQINNAALPAGSVIEVAEDGKSLVISIPSANKMQEGLAYRVTAKDLKTEDNKSIQDANELVIFSDKVAPEITKVESKSGISGTNTVTVEMSEPIVSGQFFVDGSPTSANFNLASTGQAVVDNKEITLSTTQKLEPGKTYTLRVVNAVDTAGNALSTKEVQFTVVSETSEGKFVKATVAGENKVKLTFDKPLDATLAVATANYAVTKIGGTVTVSGAMVDPEDSKSVILTLATPFAANQDAVTVYVSASNLKDTFGNKVEAVSNQAVTLTKDVVKPSLVSSSVTSDRNALILEMTEIVTLPGAPITLTGVDKDGVLVTRTATASYVNARGDASVAATKYVKLTLSSPLAAGSYSFNVAANTFVDQAITPNGNAAFNLNVNVTSAADTVRPTVSSIPGTVTVNSNGTAQFEVAYSEEMGASALSASNYSLNGAPLPAGSTVVFTNSNKNTVRIVMPAGSFTRDENATIIISGLVTDATGNALKEVASDRSGFTGTIRVLDNKAPELIKSEATSGRELVLTFSEPVEARQLGAVGGTELTVGTTSIDLQAASSAVVYSGNQVTITLAPNALDAKNFSSDKLTLNAGSFVDRSSSANALAVVQNATIADKFALPASITAIANSSDNAAANTAEKFMIAIAPNTNASVDVASKYEVYIVKDGRAPLSVSNLNSFTPLVSYAPTAIPTSATALNANILRDSENLVFNTASSQAYDVYVVVTDAAGNKAISSASTVSF